MKKILFTLSIVFAAQLLNAQKFEDLAKTPPMGWNSWNNFGCDVSEKLIKEIADAIVSSGMKKAGYEYVIIDDCWQSSRDKDGNIIPDPKRFPSGMKNLVDYVHSLGLKFGIYSDAGTLTCGGRPGSRGYEFQDARTYASWGVDYLKYDWCSTGIQNAESSYQIMRDALFAAGRPVVFSICEWGNNQPWLWAGKIGHLWRTSMDVQPCFDCSVNWGGLGVLQIIDKSRELRKYSGPGHWNDPDMMEVGNKGLTESENRAHFTMWAMLSAPLIAGNDLRKMPEKIRTILTNREVIAIDQDSMGIQALRWKALGTLEIWFKPLQNGDMAICFLNRDSEPKEIDFDLKDRIMDSDFGWKNYVIDKSFQIKDVWQNKILGTTVDNLKTKIAAHDVLLLRLSR